MLESINNQTEASMNKAYNPAAANKLIENVVYRCPCCDTEFTERRINLRDMKPIAYDSDLRPHYKNIDPILYDVVLCRKCGYGSLSKTFDHLSFLKAQMIMSNLPPQYKNMSFPMLFTEDIALKRYKIALINAMLTREKSGEIAYLYMRLAWIYRLKGDEQAERKMRIASLEGFLEAVRKESFPIIDYDEDTTYYVMGDMFCRQSDFEAARHYFTKVIESESASSLLKRLAREHSLTNDEK